MRRAWTLSLLITLGLLACRARLPAELTDPRSGDHAAQASVGTPSIPAAGDLAPHFELPDLEDRLWNLHDLEGRIVVLLWFDPECPFLLHAYGPGRQAGRARDHATRGTVWLAIDSNGPGRAGAARERNLAFVARHDVGHPILLDEDGAVGRAFGARLSGEVLVLGPDGRLAYRGALDNAPFGVPRRGHRVEGYVDQALEALARGEAPPTARTEPYGCRIRYSAPQGR